MLVVVLVLVPLVLLVLLLLVLPRRVLPECQHGHSCANRSPSSLPAHGPQALLPLPSNRPHLQRIKYLRSMQAYRLAVAVPCRGRRQQGLQVLRWLAALFTRRQGE